MSKGNAEIAAQVTLEQIETLIKLADAFCKYAYSLGMGDALTDNAYRNFVAIKLLGLTPNYNGGKGGNDAFDLLGREFESKTLVLPQHTFTSGRRVTNSIIDRMEAAFGWIFTTFKGALPVSCYGVHTNKLKTEYFDKWRHTLNTTGKESLDQPYPRISMKFVEKEGYKIL